MGLRLRFTSEDWERTAQNWKAWWAGELERPLVMIWCRDSTEIESFPVPVFLSQMLQAGVAADNILDLFEQQFATIHFLGDAFPRWWPNCGPGFASAFLGARVRPAENTTWFETSEVTPIDQMQLALDEENEWWCKLKTLTAAAVERWKGKVCIGFTDLGCNLDILAALRSTERLLLELVDQPEEVEKCLAQITRFWIHYYKEVDALIRPAETGTCPWAPIWSPQRCYILQSDFSYMIAPAMFQRFVLPDLAGCIAQLDHAFYHLDGKGQIPHLELLFTLERLRGIQWIPGAGAQPPEEWLVLLQRIRAAGKLCQLFVTAKGARTILDALGGQGFAFQITDITSPSVAKDYLASLHL
jgi:hypothetical protein